MKSTFTALLLLGCSLAIFAQDDPTWHGCPMHQLQKERIAFIANDLQLNEQEQKLVALYLLRMDEEKIKRMKKVRQNRTNLERKDPLSRDEYLLFLQDRAENRIAIEELDKELLEKLSETIPCDKLLRIEGSKQRFMHQFLLHKK